MFFYEGLSCPYCHTRFEEADDIVACPTCGAPHHRDCWKEHGTCAHADTHGTDEQWTRDGAFAEMSEDEDDTAVRRHPCGNCGTDNSPYAEFCSHCGRALDAEAWESSQEEPTTSPFDAPPYTSSPFSEYAPFRSQTSYYAGMSPEETIDGETVADLVTVVQTNTPYYLPKFRAMSQKNAKLSWNWAAFLIPSYWLLFRKQYLLGSLLLLLEITLSTLTMAAVFSFSDSLGAVSSSADLVMHLLEAARSDPYLQNVVHFIGAIGVLLLLSRLIVALFGNCWYMSHTKRLIRRSRDLYPEGYQAQLTAAGGTSFILALIGYMCMQTMPMMILMMIGV